MYDALDRVAVTLDGDAYRRSCHVDGARNALRYAVRGRFVCAAQWARIAVSGRVR